MPRNLLQLIIENWELGVRVTNFWGNSRVCLRMKTWNWEILKIFPLEISIFKHLLFEIGNIQKLRNGKYWIFDLPSPMAPLLHRICSVYLGKIRMSSQNPWSLSFSSGNHHIQATQRNAKVRIFQKASKLPFSWGLFMYEVFTETQFTKKIKIASTVKDFGYQGQKINFII